MFRLLNRLREKTVQGLFPQAKSKDRPVRRNAGQIAVVLIFIIAAALVLYAITINIGRVSQSKTYATKAAYAASSYMASAFASYGEKLFVEVLGGQDGKVCGWTGLLGALLTFLVAVIAIIVSYYLPPAGGFAWALFTAGTIAAVASLGAIALELLVIQPGIDKLWNKMISNNLGLEDQFLEGGIRIALQNAVTDTLTVPDYWDLDQDSIYNDTAGPDRVNRFAVYYTERLREMNPDLTIPIKEFQAALEEYYYENPDPAVGDDFALLDPIFCGFCPPFGGENPCCPLDPANDPEFPAECDPCCIPLEIFDETLGQNFQIQATCCQESGADSCGNPDTCEARSAYPGYPYVYRPTVEDRWNTFYSFSETLGRDDEHPDFMKTVASGGQIGDEVNWTQVPRGSGPIPENVPDYYMSDTTGYYRMPLFPQDNDLKIGSFMHFYKLADWGVELSDDPDFGVDYGAGGDPSWEQCHWCQQGGLANDGQCDYSLSLLTPQLAKLDPVTGARTDETFYLPHDPGPVDLVNAIYSGGWCVDNLNDPAAAGPLRPDKVPYPQMLLAEDDMCPNDESQDNHGWKRGADRFCSNTWLYYEACPKQESCGDPSDPAFEGCECGETDPTLWNEDPLDFLVYSIEDFWFLADRIINSSLGQLVADFKNWYIEMAEWIEPAGKFTERDEDGYILFWRQAMEYYVQEITNWTLLPFTDYGLKITPEDDTTLTGADCGEVWCIPPEQGAVNNYGVNECACVTPANYTTPDGVDQVGEASTFDFNANGIRGDMEDVVACLKWNTDNAKRFSRCQEECLLYSPGSGTSTPESRASACAFLPRSLVPGMCDYVFDPGDEELSLELQACLDAIALGDYTACVADCEPLLGDVTNENGDTVTIDPFIAPMQPCPPDTVINAATEEMVCPAGYDPNNPPPDTACWCTNEPMTYRECSATEFVNPSVETRICSSANPFACICVPEPPPPTLTMRECTDTELLLEVDPGPPPVYEQRYCVTDPPVECLCGPIGSSSGTESRSCAPGGELPDETIVCPDPIDPTDPEPCTCTRISGSCGDFLYSDTLAQALFIAVGSCGDNSPGGFLELLQQSIIEAENQGTKFIHRIQFLTGETKEPPPGQVFPSNPFSDLPIYGDTWAQIQEGRLTEMLAFQDTMAQALEKTSVFLDGPAADLIQARIDLENGDLSPPLSSVAVYVWQDKINVGYQQDGPRQIDQNQTSVYRGLWHAVKVEARVPSRCNDACGYDPGSAAGFEDPPLPQVVTYKKSFGLRRCYELKNTEGMVKVRVIRYDESPFTGHVTTPDGRTLWQMRLFHPSQESDSNQLDFDSVPGPCVKYIHPDLFTNQGGAGAGGFFDSFRHAFMLNRPGGGCWNWVHSNMLNRGVETTSCAVYVFGYPGGDSFGYKGMNLHTRRCDAGFRAGSN